MNRVRTGAASPYQLAGLSLIELMIAIALVALILAGVVKLYADSHRSYLANQGVSRTQEGMRYVFDHLSRAAARAGYMGCAIFEPEVDSIGGSNVESLLGSEVGVGGKYDFATSAVFGTNDDGVNNSDTLVLRAANAAEGIAVIRANPTQVTADATQISGSGIEAGDVMLISDCKNIGLFMVTGDPSGGVINHAVGSVDGQSNVRDKFTGRARNISSEGNLATLYPVKDAVVAYRIDTSAAAPVGSVCSAGTPEYCALFANDDELLDGVEDMQIRYGRRGGLGTISYRDASQITDWREVIGVKVEMTINSVERSFSSQSDGLVRKTISKTIALRNGDL